MSLFSLLELAAACYLLELLFFGYASFRSRRVPSIADTNAKLPKVSVIVAAKDEEKNLPNCLASLVNLEYPRDLLEVIIVNDQSKDGTRSLIDEISHEFTFVRRVDAVDSVELQGKANALSQGIDESTGEIIFLTDADCTAPPNWINETLKYFEPDTGIVGGVTLISRTETVVQGVQAVDWDILLTIAAGAATIGKPIACLGNNLAVRRKAYDEAGGYRKIKFSVTEDFALFKAVADSGNWHFSFPMNKKAHVETLPVNTIGELFSQRKRWATGGKDTGLYGYVTLLPGFVLHWLIISSLFFSVPLFLLLFVLKTLSDTLFAIPTLMHYGKIAHLKFMVYFEIYYLIYVAILPFSVYFGKEVTWKGRKYKTRHNE